ncbi:flagellin [Brevibacillus sp. NRS-1366]|uniref:flagellin N-terminal helical domain-containing protein n=1 Tax=Brevibacillus sp. NRS-1366 TaxID=3233899 RepID=UPI003D1D0BE0
MVIQSNVPALNTLNRLQKNNKNTASALERLSSGLRINKAADDAAGLSISEKMRAQIRGLNQAQRNIQDGISLVQTAEGGLAVIHDPHLQRLRELAVQSANDTLTHDDRHKIQEEIEQIKKAIDEIANNTEFNGIKLLNVPDSGTVTKTTEVMKSVTKTETTYVPEVVDLAKATSITIYEKSTSLNELTIPITSFPITLEWSPPDSPTEKYWFDIYQYAFQTTAYGPESGYTPGNNITGVRLNGLSGYDGVTEMWANKLLAYTGAGWEPSDAEGDHSPDAILGSDLSDYPKYTQGSNILLRFEYMRAVTTTTTVTVPELITIEESIDPKVILQVGANAGDTFGVDLSDVRVSSLGIDQIMVDPRDKAVEAIGKIDVAISKVSSERSKYGAYQNALEHIHNNVANYSLNLSSAESRIRDADMAKEMMEMTKSNILAQAAQAMLVQANQTPESVLQLLR